MTHTVTDIQRFCMHDGPGIRTTVFLKGCPLNCFWCHNPETKNSSPQLMYYSAKCIDCRACFSCKNNAHYRQNGIHKIDFKKCIACGECTEVCPSGALAISGKIMDSQEIIDAVNKDIAFYGKDGGITISGGEPMFHPDACIELLKLAKENGLHTAVETCGYFHKKYIKPLCEVSDILLWDIKDTNNFRHKLYTGVSNIDILDNLRLADSFDVPIILRCIMLEGLNLEKEHLNKVKSIYSSLKNAVAVDYLPCHSLGTSKCEAIGANPINLTKFELSREEMNNEIKRLSVLD